MSFTFFVKSFIFAAIFFNNTDIQLKNVLFKSIKTKKSRLQIVKPIFS